MATNDSSIKVFRSKVFTTEEVTAVFPHLNEVTKYGYDISVDVLENTEFLKKVTAQAKVVLAAGQKKFDTKKKPTNDIVKSGKYKGEPWSRMAFRMKGSKNIKGVDVPQSPRLVDADRFAMDDEIWGGSLVKISYHIQYTITPTGTYLSLKLNAVQVLKLVGPNGEVAVEDMFDVEEGGFVSKGEESLPQEPGPLPDYPQPTQEPDAAPPVASGSDF